MNHRIIAWLGVGICLLCAWRAAAEAGLKARHADGVTTLEYDSGGGKLRNCAIFRSDAPITPENWRRAACVIDTVAPGASAVELAATENGDAYYALVGDGRELLAATAVALPELDRTAPAVPEIAGRYVDGRAELSWSAPGTRNPEKIVRYELYREDEPVASVKPSLRRVQRWSPDELQRDGGVFALAAVDAAGNRSALSEPFSVHLAADLAIDSAPRVARNRDLSVSKMYPQPGEAVEFAATVRNIGAKASTPCRVTVTGGDGAAILNAELPAIPAADSARVRWRFTPSGPGEFRQVLSIDPDESVADSARGNNRLEIVSAASAKPVYFIWYGNVRQLTFANGAQTPPVDLAEWARRGAIGGAGAGAVGDILSVYRELAAEHYPAIFIDEIHMWGDAAQNVAARLPAFKQQHPEAFVALWNIGEDAAPEIAQLVKDGVVDLLMLEIYLKPGEKFDNFDRAIANMRRLGIADRTVIGLVTHRDWNNWVSPEEQARYVVEEMRYIAQAAPEMPGFAFWSDDAYIEVLEAADRAGYELKVLNGAAPEKTSAR